MSLAEILEAIYAGDVAAGRFRGSFADWRAVMAGSEFDRSMKVEEERGRTSRPKEGRYREWTRR